MLNSLRISIIQAQSNSIKYKKYFLNLHYFKYLKQLGKYSFQMIFLVDFFWPNDKSVICISFTMHYFFFNHHEMLLTRNFQYFPVVLVKNIIKPAIDIVSSFLARYNNSKAIHYIFIPHLKNTTNNLFY